MNCSQCHQDVRSAGLGRDGWICDACQQKNRLAFADEIPAIYAGLVSPHAIELMQAHVRAFPHLHSTRETLRAELRKADPPRSAAVRYAVRCLPLRPGPGWTVAVFESEDAASKLRAFWGNWIYTEVAIVRLETGQDPDARALISYERFPGRPPRPTPPRRPPQRRPWKLWWRRA